jgi:hypothetical protein
MSGLKRDRSGQGDHRGTCLGPERSSTALRTVAVEEPATRRLAVAFDALAEVI